MDHLSDSCAEPKKSRMVRRPIGRYDVGAQCGGDVIVLFLDVSFLRHEPARMVSSADWTQATYPRCLRIALKKRRMSRRPVGPYDGSPYVFPSWPVDDYDFAAADWTLRCRLPHGGLHFSRRSSWY